MATVTIKHATLTGAAANPNVLVDGPKWDATHTVTGLENVDNTSDVNKPVSTAQAAAIAAAVAAPVAVSQLPPGVAVFDSTTVELWLASGQSNMARSPAYSWSPPSNAKIWNLTLATDGSVGTAFVALPTTTITVCNAFIADRARRYPNKTIYLLNVSKESNPIAQWLPGASSVPPLMDVYANIQANITGALAAAGVTTLTGFLFWGNETDCTNGSTTWRTDIETVITRFQTNSWCPATIPWVFFGIGGRNNNSGAGISGDNFNNQYILPAVNASPQYRRFVNTAALPYISADGVQYWETVTPGHMLGQGYFEVGGIASKSFYHDAGGLVLRSQQPLELAGIGTIDSPVTWNFNTAASVAPLTNTLFHAVCSDTANPVFDIDTYGSLGLTYFFRHAGGSLGAKTAVGAGVTTHQYGAATWDGTSYSTNVKFRFVTVNAQSGTDHSSGLIISTVPPGSTTVTDVAYFYSGFSVDQNVDPGAGIINALTGFRVNNAATSGNVLRGNGTNFVSAQLAISDLATFSSASLRTALTDESGTGAAYFQGGDLGTPSAGVATNLTGTASSLTAGNVTTNANLTGDVTSVGNATTLTNAPVIAKVLTGLSASAGTIAATDTILQAFNKVAGLVDNAAWTSYTPTITSGTGTITTSSATGRYKQIGKTVNLQITITITTAGTGAGQLIATLPVTAKSTIRQAGAGVESTVGNPCHGQILTSDSTHIYMAETGGGTTIANGNVVTIGIVYEAA